MMGCRHVPLHRTVTAVARRRPASASASSFDRFRLIGQEVEFDPEAFAGGVGPHVGVGPHRSCCARSLRPRAHQVGDLVCGFWVLGPEVPLVLSADRNLADAFASGQREPSLGRAQRRLKRLQPGRSVLPCRTSGQNRGRRARCLVSPVHRQRLRTEPTFRFNAGLTGGFGVLRDIFGDLEGQRQTRYVDDVLGRSSG